MNEEYQMTIKEREELIRQNSIQLNLASDLDFPWLEDDVKDVPPIEECEDYAPTEQEKEFNNLHIKLL